MNIWKYSKYDAILFFAVLMHLVVVFSIACEWGALTFGARVLAFLLMIVLAWYNLIIVSHQFTHTPWFESKTMNWVVSIINSINIGQSMKEYHLRHVRNHHRFHNDQYDSGSPPRDWASTFRHGVNGEHASLFRYAVVDACPVFFRLVMEMFSFWRGWKVSSKETDLIELLPGDSGRRARELRQIQMERIVRCTAFCVLFVLSPAWVLLVYLPVFYFSLVMFNVQNYFEHVGGDPDNPLANSTSYYGRIYNALMCNDGYHQEHHLRPNAHWRNLPKIRLAFEETFARVERVISAAPAIIGFLDRERPMLHRMKH
ncbi:fatty acid desaturase [Burkholderia sp. Bp9126]|nr:fatty acid desaturase [Burkholderia sp. Bp9126]